MLEDFRLKVFLTVESEGSFTKAARNLGISQPAVSQNIAELERETGEELFHRNKGSVTLTPAGTTFKRYAERIHHWCSVAEDVFGSAGKLKDASPVTIMADGFASESVLPGVLGSITVLNPDLSFKVIPPVRPDVIGGRGYLPVFIRGGGIIRRSLTQGFEDDPSGCASGSVDSIPAFASA